MAIDGTERVHGTGAVLVATLWLGCMAWPIRTAAQEPQTIVYEEHFEGDLQGWELEGGWAVVDHSLQGEGHYWARPGAGPWQDFRLQLRLNLVRGVVHLVYRMNDAGRYFIGFREHGSYLHKQYWPDTFISDLAGSAVSHGRGRWHQVEIVGQGPRIRFLVDGVTEWEYIDPEPLLQGGFAFETLDDSTAHIDDIIVYASAPGTGSSWVRTGGPLGGLGYDVRMRPDNTNVMYVTDAKAGVHMSTDGGQTWFPSNQGITTRSGESGDIIPVFCLTIDPHDYDAIWIGTQDIRGIFKSTDGGRTWVEKDHGVTETMGITFRGFTVDPRSSDIVYAAAELASWVWAGEPRSGREFDMTKGVIYKTTNGGESWTAVWRGDNLARYIWIDPGNPDTVYVSTGIFDREAANSVPGARIPGGVGILKSTDGGQTWTQANDGLGNLYVGTLFLHPQDPAVLLAGTGNNQYYDGQGVYLSVNGGASWQQTLPGDNINAVEFALSNPQIAYAGSAQAVYRSADAGRTWQKVCGGADGWGPPGVRAGFPIDFQVDPQHPDRLFANNYGGGNFLSVDGGRTWTVASKGYTGAQVRDVAVDPADGTRIYAAARSGLFVSADAGDDWDGLSYPPFSSLEWYAIAIDPTDSRHVLAANNWNSRLLESHDRGLTFHAVSGDPGANRSWRAIAFAPSEPTTVYAGTSAYYSAGTFADQMAAAGIYVSRDGGLTWTPANDTVSGNANVIDLAVDRNDSRTVYAATGNQGLLKTTDGGQSWRRINQGLSASPTALSVTIHPTNPSTLYAGLGAGGLYRSWNSGDTWQAVPAGLNPEASISDILFDPTDSQRVYMADKFSGVYRSDNGGTIWAPINDGLRVRAVNALAISSDGRHLYAATEGEGIFRLDLGGGE
jgi:photosystem II stability/assembly factor-like uncharacterized protein